MKTLRIYKKPYGAVLFNTNLSELFYVDKRTLKEIIKKKKIEDYIIKGFSEVSTLVWKITSFCPYNCVYCSQEKKHSAFFFNYPLIKKLNPARISITGGEPSTIKGLENILEKLLHIVDEISIITNGYRLIDVPERTRVCVSLDSHIKEINEKTRPGTFENSMRALDYYYEKGVLSSVNTVVTEYNAPYLKEFGDFLSKYDVSWNLAPVQPFGKGKNFEYQKKIVDIIKELENEFHFVRKDRFKENMLIRYFGCWFPERPNVFFMDEVGNLCYCIEAYNHGILENIRKIPVHFFSECSSCESRFICGGGCRVSRLVHKRKKEYCDSFKKSKYSNLPNFNLPELETEIKTKYPEFSPVLSFRSYIPELEEICYDVYLDLVFRKSDRMVQLLFSNVVSSEGIEFIKDYAILWYVDVVMITGLGEISKELREFLGKIKENLNSMIKQLEEKKRKYFEKGRSLSIQIIEILSNERIPQVSIEIENEINELKGLIASPGDFEGKVCVITNSKKSFTGDILVAEFTTSELIPYIKKSKGVITERGGYLSHAAIICRELGIPCVVGVKGLLKAVKDGDYIICKNGRIFKKT